MCRNFPLDTFTRMQVWRQLLDGHTDAMVFRQKWPQKKRSRVTSGSVHFFYLLIIVIISTIIVVIVFFLFCIYGWPVQHHVQKSDGQQKKTPGHLSRGLDLTILYTYKIVSKGSRVQQLQFRFPYESLAGPCFPTYYLRPLFQGPFLPGPFFPRPDAMGITPGWV